MKQWYALVFAVIAEVIGTTMIKIFGSNESITRYGFIFIFIGISYFLLSKAITRIPISTAYAVWEGLGLVFITLIGWFMFKETLPLGKIVGFSAIFLGIVLLKNGTTGGENHE
ncbi:DMT family transporter [Pectinatus sottacetonis]|uniref:DMT family transporter n=1 Tax=Pectinatus sottacetonis TaxID=1002795 RepID=UPI0018C78F43|nr:multidrug efflux SMR transporter [Pectinatus sottacetonis]